MEKTKEVSKKVETPKAETVNKGYKTELPELLTFLQAGAHFGHKKSAWSPKMSKYIYEVRNGIHIIDIVKSRKRLPPHHPRGEGQAHKKIQERY